VQKRDEAYALAIASDDELFHFYLYDWHVARHLSEQLLEVRDDRPGSAGCRTDIIQFDTPYIEKYLQITSSGVEERRDLLWKYYARREEYLAASKALFELATRHR
jgi:nuclear pore complex protein Nup155